MTETEQTGLAGIIVGDTALSTVGKAGIGLTYRGYDIHELAASATFEEVAYLLIYRELPSESELKTYCSRLVALRAIPNELKLLLETMPGSAHPMDVLRTGISLLGTLEPESTKHSAYQIADRLIACAPSILLYWYQFYRNNKRLDITQYADKTTADFFLHALTGKKPEQEQGRALDVALILYAEHEFNASTFAARVTISTGSDFYSAVVSAIGTLRGPLHGGANEEAMRLIASFQMPNLVEATIKSMLVDKVKIMGFGHRVYKISDPRSDVVKAWVETLSKNSSEAPLFDIAQGIEKVMWREKKLFPNLDFYSALLFHFCDIPTLLFTPIFVMSRLSGWSAHILEQRAHNRLIRPEAKYIGMEKRSFKSLKDRTSATSTK
ncbi:MAG: 2-methylcitrate synthase [Gammaproteobacteria bacterium RIFCSPHIGHO2_12_FULL_42_10]|nr:MAG: 2-methylcitrate synthase [Gammaproteobacteria bacterium RIFCSPHIGHO2_12_FULL_42_10]